jgi:hypothetical protein
MSGTHRKTPSGALRRHSATMPPSPGQSTALSSEEASFAAAAQELASVLNAPTAGSSWLGAWPFGLGEDADAKPPSLPPGTLPEVRNGGCKSSVDCFPS